MAIIGSSGSGKTTLLRCLNFLETPDAGTISVRGETFLTPLTLPRRGSRRSGRSGSISGWSSSPSTSSPVYRPQERDPSKRAAGKGAQRLQAQRQGPSQRSWRRTPWPSWTRWALGARRGCTPISLRRTAAARGHRPALASSPMLCFDEPTSPPWTRSSPARSCG